MYTSIILCFFYSVAQSLGPDNLIYSSGSAENVTDCRGDEASLNECPTLPTPDNCRHCVLVNCNVHIVPTSSIEADGSTSTSIKSFSETPHLISSIEATSGTPAIGSTSSQVTMTTTTTTSSQPVSKVKTLKTATTPVSMTMKPHPSPVVPMSSGNEFLGLNLNTTNVMVIGGITVVIVAAGIITSTCLIIRGVKKRHGNRSKKIVMKKNDAYMDSEEVLRLQNGGPDRGLHAVPIYEQIE